MTNKTPSKNGKNQFPYTDHYERFGKYDPEDIRNICTTLSKGDKVLINKRERPLTVKEVEDCRTLNPVELGDTGIALDIGPEGWCVHLRGNGTRYEIHVRTSDSTKAHMLVWPSGEQAVGYIDLVSNGEIVEPTIRSSITATDVLEGDLR